MNIYDPKAPKKAVNLSVNADLLSKARALGLNLSNAFEASLSEAVRTAEQQRWRLENSDAITDHNRRIGERGLFSDGKRQF